MFRRVGGVFETHPVLCLLLIAYLSLGCSRPNPPTSRPAPAGPPWFEDATERLGLNFVHDPGPTGSYFMPQIMGSGGALLDCDGDGRLDIYLLQNAGPESKSTNRLFRQGTDGRFVDVSEGSGLDVAGFGMGVAAGDVNNDGRPDVLVTEYGRARLFRNDGGFHFTDISKEAGIDNPTWGTSACFLDFDRDGWLDLVIVNYLDYDPSLRCAGASGRQDYCHPRSFAGTTTRLFHNLGRKAAETPNQIRFENVTLRSGLGKVPGPGLGIVCADFDGDGWPDIFVANDASANRLWINQKNGTFRDEAVARGVAYDTFGSARADMGLALGDIDGDGLFDLFSTHLTEEMHSLWRQEPRGHYRDVIATTGLSSPHWRGTGFGTSFADFDRDGILDLAIANGRVIRAGSDPGGDFWNAYRERSQIFGGEGKGKFRDLSLNNPDFSGKSMVARGLCVGDIDGDGAVDLLVTTVGGPARIFRNVAPNRGHWLQIRAVDPAQKRDALGAVVIVRSGKQSWVRMINPGQSYLSSHDPRAHFGFGQIDRIDAIRVLWPDGVEEEFSEHEVDRSITISKGAGRPAN